MVFRPLCLIYGVRTNGNGNTIADGLHTYSWDAAGKMLTVDYGTSNGVCLTYDALGRMVEQARGSACNSSYTQILYSPTGGKLALMSGQSVNRAFIPSPAGATAVYTSGSTLSYFRHPDWLGSSRLATTPARMMYSGLAYAPFGETHAEAGPPDRSFTGQNQDTVQGSTTGLYDFMFREYAQYGRWISPDPAGRAAADITNPQSLNRYAYVLNRPLQLVDPLGLQGCHQDDDCPSGESGIIPPFAGGFGGGSAPRPMLADRSPQALDFLQWFSQNNSIFIFFQSEDAIVGDVFVFASGTLAAGPDTITAASSGSGGGSANYGTIRSVGKIHCASAVANSMSLANQPSLPGPSHPHAPDKALAYVASAVFGNTFSGIVDFYDTVTTATNAAPVYLALITNGVRMGLPGGGILSKGAVGVAQDAVLKAAFSNLGVAASVKAANVVGLAKIGYDLATFGYGIYQCTNF